MAGGLGFAVGRSSHQDQPPSPQPIKTVVQTQTKEVERRVEVPSPYIPSKCKEALGYAQELNKLIDQYENEFGKEDRILADAFTAIEDRSIPELNAVTQRQYNLKAKTIGILLEIQDKRSSLDASLKQCSPRVAR